MDRRAEYNLRYCKVWNGLNNLATLPAKRIQALLISTYATMYRSDTRFLVGGNESACCRQRRGGLCSRRCNRRSDYIFILLACNYFRRVAINAGLRKLEYRWKINVRETLLSKLPYARCNLFCFAKPTNYSHLVIYGSALIYTG